MEGKVFAVTGASGMGLATAKQLRKQGALVSLADISQKSLDDSFRELDSSEQHVMLTKVDVRDDSQVKDWIKATVEKFGRLDGAANMAGVIGKHHGVREIRDQDDEQWNLIMAVNVTGVMHCLRAEIRNMKEGGSIVNAASIQGLQGFAKHAAYSASKHAVIGLTRSVAKEVAPQIRVNAVAPGMIQTPLLDHGFATHGPPEVMPGAMARIGSAEEAAAVIVFLLSPASSFVTGCTYPVDGGWAC